jgi:hypothetical protein
MCDNPEVDAWHVEVDPALVRVVLESLRSKVNEKGLEYLQSEIPGLKTVPRESLLKILEVPAGSEHTKGGLSQHDLMHMEFDVERLKRLSAEELRHLLGNKLVPRIIDDLKNLELNRPVPDWCYAFF